MRFLVISDLHANATALTAAIAAAEGRWERAICLGDVVGYGPDPNEVVDRVRGMAPAIIRGNHDKAASGLSDSNELNPVARAAIEWTRAQLHPENLEYITKLPAGPLEADGLTIVHGSFQNEDEYVVAPAQALQSLMAAPHDVTFFGHTHFQGGFAYRNSRLEMIRLQPPPGGPNFAALRLEPGTRYLLNPGSIGQPRDGDPRAGFAVADLDHGVVEFWRVPYDIQAVQERMRKAGLPEPLASRLTYGH